jgi:hypothetical protein
MLGYDTQVLETAEWLADKGKTVYLVSGAPVQAWEKPDAALANDKNGYTARHLMMNFVMNKIHFLPFKMVKAIERGAVILSRAGEQNPCTTHVRNDSLEDERLEIDNVIIHLRQHPVDRWLEPLGNETGEVYRIGDCLEPRQAIDAMADGGRIGRLV